MKMWTSSILLISMAAFGHTAQISACLPHLNPALLSQSHKDLTYNQIQTVEKSLGLKAEEFVELYGREADVLLHLTTGQVYKFFHSEYAFQNAIKMEELMEPILDSVGIQLQKKILVKPELHLIVRGYNPGQQLFQIAAGMYKDNPVPLAQIQAAYRKKFDEVKRVLAEKHKNVVYGNEDSGWVGFPVLYFSIRDDNRNYEVNLHSQNVMIEINSVDFSQSEFTVIDIY